MGINCLLHLIFQVNPFVLRDLQMFNSIFNLAGHIAGLVNDTQDASDVTLLQISGIFKRMKPAQEEVSSIFWRIFLFSVDADDVAANFSGTHLL